MEVQGWIYEGREIKNSQDGFYGFIYKITNLDNGWIYIGRKAFEHSHKKIISKKIRKESGSKKRVEKIKKDSGWIDYFGSSEYLKKDLEANKYNCKREILKFCKDKISLNFWEVAIMIENNVLFRNDCYNGSIAGKWFKNKVHL